MHHRLAESERNERGKQRKINSDQRGMSLRKNELRERRRRLRRRVADRLNAEGSDEEAKKLYLCGQESSLVCIYCGNKHPIVRTCKRRWCPVCAHQRAGELIARYARIVKKIGYPLMLTLTLPHTVEDAPAERLDALKVAMKKIKRQKWFKEKVRGGIGAIEASGSGRHGWHIHAHLLLDCEWLSVTTSAPEKFAKISEFRKKSKKSQAEVSDQWAMAAGVDQAHIWIKRGDKKSIVEALKYAVKPQAMLESPMRITPLIEAFKERRLVSAWGTIRKMAKVVKEEMESEKKPLVCECGEADWMPEEAVSGEGRLERAFRENAEVEAIMNEVEGLL